MPEPIIDVRELRVTFGAGAQAFTALDHVSLTVGKGAFTALVGPSGSGKSVLALSLCRLIRDDGHSGGVYYYFRDGSHLDLFNCPEPELRRVRGRELAYVFQEPGAALNPVIRVGPQVHKDRARALELLSLTGFADPERVHCSYPHELSGGMKQRATIAAALSQDPRVLIADEPTTALDPDAETGILELLKRLQKDRGLTILFITHDIALARRYADAFHILERGRTAPHDGELARRLMAASLEGLKPKQEIPV